MELSKREVNLLTLAGVPVFDEYDAWLDAPGTRASINRGQEDLPQPAVPAERGCRQQPLHDRHPPGSRSEHPDPAAGVPHGNLLHLPRHGARRLRQPRQPVPRPRHRRLARGQGRRRQAANALDPAGDLPQFKLTCTSGDHPFLGDTIVVNDPGRALVTGKCRDIGSFVVPSLRGLAAREPYFHDGSAKNLRGVVDFYSARFKYLDPADPVLADADPANDGGAAALPLSEQEKVDLVNFLTAL